MAILGPEIAQGRRITRGTPDLRDGASDAGSTAAVAGAPENSADPAADTSAVAVDSAAVDSDRSDELSAGRRENERRRAASERVSHPDRRTPEDRRDVPDRRATRLERERRLTPAGRHALRLLAATAENPVPLTGDSGLLNALVTDILQRGLEVEIAGHLGHGRWEPSSRGAENIRNGAYPKRVLTDLGVITVQMPRDRRGTFEPVIVPKHGRRLLAPTSNLAAIYASGMTRTEIRSQLDNITQSRLQRDIVETFTDELEPEIRAWQRRRFDGSYPVLLIDSITLSGRGLRTTRRSLDVAVAIDAYGDFELLGLWRRPSRTVPGGERWAPILDELHYRGISAIEFIASTRARGLAEAAEAVFPLAKVRPGVEALMQNTLRFSE